MNVLMKQMIVDAGYSCSNEVGSFSCVDNDECALGTDDCDSGFSCSNTQGSFDCLRY